MIQNKKILIVNNTLSTGGAEIMLLRDIDKYLKNNNKVYLYIMTSMGELIDSLPKNVVLLNKSFSKESVLSAKGKKILMRKILFANISNATFFRLFGYNIKALSTMIKQKRIYGDKLAWMTLAKAAPSINIKFDLAIAYTEGASTYFCADKVVADKKIAYVHTNYEESGYNKTLDTNAYDSYDEIKTVAESTKKAFLQIHPECKDKISLIDNCIDKQYLLQKSQEKFLDNEAQFSKNNDVIKILTVSRLVSLKRYDLLIDTAKNLVNKDYKIDWIALGEGELHNKLQKTINENNIQDSFRLLGNVTNPYKYMKSCDIYVQTSEYEGKSQAIQEAKTLNCKLVISDIAANKNIITNKNQGYYCDVNSEDITNKIIMLIKDINKLV